MNILVCYSEHSLYALTVGYLMNLTKRLRQFYQGIVTRFRVTGSSVHSVHELQSGRTLTRKGGVVFSD